MVFFVSFNSITEILSAPVAFFGIEFINYFLDSFLVGLKSNASFSNCLSSIILRLG